MWSFSNHCAQYFVFSAGYGPEKFGGFVEGLDISVKCFHFSFPSFYFSSLYHICTELITVASRILTGFGYRIRDKISLSHPNQQDDSTSSLPDGIFHYSNKEMESDANFNLPHFYGSQEEINPMTIANELLNAISSAKQKNEELTGISLPMPFGMKPLRVKLANSRKKAFRMGKQFEEELEVSSESPKSSSNIPLKLDRASWKALKNARLACLQDDQNACDQALEKYHQLRFNTSPVTRSREMRAILLKHPESFILNSFLKWIMPNLKSLN
ncbi:unnamed protein product [Thelazia callipaeda]|uniref:HMG box domain-containing protein n=1 Tax=Thelazia callipaeda TaxID=103827 RepID=A0A0N5CLA6_THECL|nr:unnamed protein product [Thelazia callipaeda]